jgi:hypothetical protein
MFKSAFGFALALTASVPAFASNLVTNGDFAGGNAGFTSGYTYVAPTFNSMYPESTYTVFNNANGVHDQWAAVTGQGGAGDFLIVNGATAGNIDVWKSVSIAVTPNTNYFFEAYATNVCCGAFVGSSSKLTFAVDGDATSATLSTFDTAASPVGTWQFLSNTWNSGSNTSVTLTLKNASTEFSGNDFGVDSINFGTVSIGGVPEPTSWAMLITGFGMVGFAARRRRSAVAA